VGHVKLNPKGSLRARSGRDPFTFNDSNNSSSIANSIFELSSNSANLVNAQSRYSYSYVSNTLSRWSSVDSMILNCAKFINENTE